MSGYNILFRVIFLLNFFFLSNIIYDVDCKMICSVEEILFDLMSVLNKGTLNTVKRNPSEQNKINR